MSTLNEMFSQRMSSRGDIQDLFNTHLELKELYYRSPIVHVVVDNIQLSTNTDQIIDMCLQLATMNYKLQSTLEDAVKKGYRPSL